METFAFNAVIYIVCVCVRACVCVCGSGGDETESRGKLSEMEMFWREIFREVCTRDYAYRISSIRGSSRTRSKLHRALQRSVLCDGKLCLNDDISSSLVWRVRPVCVFRICSARSAFNQREPKYIFGFLPDMLFVANYI